jgi:ribonuclease H / adenosylcobalamin/alpha-ribazole phosphatase
MSPGSDGTAPEGARSAGDGSAVPSQGWRRQEARATTTLLVRHGQTPLSAERRFAGRGDIPLTELGRAQAAATAARLAASGVDNVVTSPLRRARNTAEAIAEAARAVLTVDDDLAETDFGRWEGMSFGEVAARWPAEMAAWLADAEAAPVGGESFGAVGRRVLVALGRLLQAYPGKTVVVVSHVTPIKTLICQALLAPPAALFRMQIDVASISEIDWFEDGAGVLRSFNDTAHLRDERPRDDREAVRRST